MINTALIIYFTSFLVKCIIPLKQNKECCFTSQFFEIVMLICFGMSWPISVYKSFTSHSTKGKSVVFIFAVLMGYLSGIVGKLVSGQINYVLILYLINLCMVTLDLVLYYVNQKRET